MEKSFDLKTKVNGYLVSTVRPSDRWGMYETMVFKLRRDGRINGDDLYVRLTHEFPNTQHAQGVIWAMEQ